jgi:DNA-binding Xre family transcriptional regulator
MNQTRQLKQTLKQVLRGRDVTYRELAGALHLSEATVKRMLAGGTLTLQRLERICEILEINLYDLVRQGRQEAEQPRELSLEQEEALARDLKLFMVFHLLLNGWTVPEILADYALSQTELIRLLVRLDRLKLIELLPQDRVRLRCARRLAWRPDGPVRQVYQGRIIQEFFAAAPGEVWFEVKELSPAALGLMHRKLQRIAAEFDELAEADAMLPRTERISVGLALACRPWALQATAALRRKKSSSGG